jgi:hypothetical protein
MAPFLPSLWLDFIRSYKVWRDSQEMCALATLGMG